MEEKLEDMDATRMSLANAMARPAPAAMPFIAVITGCGTNLICGPNSTVGGPCGSGVLPSRVSSCWFTSAPEQKPRPAPVIIIALTFWSVARSSRTLCRSATSAALSALSFSGLLRVTVATKSRNAKLILSYSSRVMEAYLD